MIIKRLISRNIHKYISFDISFYRDVTFIHGINGSGKTTAVRAIMALLVPDMKWLTTVDFERIELRFENAGFNYILAAAKIKDGSIVFEFGKSSGEFDDIEVKKVEYSTSSQPELFEIDDDQRLPAAALNKLRLIERARRNPLMREIEALPTPIFLGLERTTLSEAVTTERNPRSPERDLRPYFRTSMDESVREAERVITRQYSIFRVARDKEIEELRNNITLALFVAPERKTAKFQNLNTMLVPDGKDIQEFKSLNDKISKSLKKAQIDSKLVESTVDAFFSNLIKTANEMAKFKSQKELLEAFAVKEGSVSIRDWLTMLSQLDFIQNIVRQINKFDEAEARLYADIKRYEGLVNRFLKDSNKEIVFAPDGGVVIKLPSGGHGPVSMLSSGERQLFVLLTHLYFNPLSKKANVLIIDEPELSLHLKWQEEFVDAVMEANSDIQIILATHSPSIIADRENRCKTF